MLTTTENEVLWTIYFTDVLDGYMRGYTEELITLEKQKEKHFNNVQIDFYHYEEVQGYWHTHLKVKQWITDFLQSNPQLFYFLTTASCRFVIQCLSSEESDDFSIQMANCNTFKSAFTKSLEYCVNDEQRIQLSNKIYFSISNNDTVMKKIQSVDKVKNYTMAFLTMLKADLDNLQLVIFYEKNIEEYTNGLFKREMVFEIIKEEVEDPSKLNWTIKFEQNVPKDRVGYLFSLVLIEDNKEKMVSFVVSDKGFQITTFFNQTSLC